MAKAKIWIEERLRYNREIDVEIPDEMTYRELEDLFDECERYRADNVDDVVRFLGKNGIKLIGQVDNDMDCPDSMSVEITEYDIARSASVPTE